MSELSLIANKVDECLEEVNSVRYLVQGLDSKLDWTAKEVFDVSSAKSHTTFMLESIMNSTGHTNDDVDLVNRDVVAMKKDVVAMKKDVAKLSRDMTKIVKLLEASAAAVKPSG